MPQAVRRFTLMLLMALTLGVSTQASANSYEVFAGLVRDTAGNPLQAEVSINGESQTTLADGYFEILVPTAPDQKYLINVHKIGYLSESIVHIGLALEAMDIRLKQAETFTVNPSQTINVTDSRGTNISIPAGSMVDAAGNPATSPLTLNMRTYDLRNEEMVGDMTAIDSTGATVALQSIGAFSAEFTDATGKLYNLAPGKLATITMPVDPANIPSDPVYLWYFDTTRGVWVEEGSATVVNGIAMGKVSHFSFWNFDMKFSQPACVKLTVDPAFFYANLQADGMFHMEATIRSPYYRFKHLNIDAPYPPRRHVLYNLATNAIVEFKVWVKNPSTGVFELKPYALVNSGGPWGGTGAPKLSQIDQCQGSLHVDSTYKVSELKGKILRQGRTSGHGGTNVQIVGASGTYNAITDNSGNFSLLVPADSLTITASRPYYLTMQKLGATVNAGATTILAPVNLPAGDIDNDGTVETSDVTSIINTITTPPTMLSPSDPRDINGNGIGDWTDASIAVGNGGLTSPQPWP